MGDNDIIIISSLHFEWDIEKNFENLKKHGVDFSEASTVFYDENAILFDDPDHSIDEDRFGIIGISNVNRFCVVIHCIRGDDERIRIISARKADKSEIDVYYKRNYGRE